MKKTKLAEQINFNDSNDKLLGTILTKDIELEEEYLNTPINTSTLENVENKLNWPEALCFVGIFAAIVCGAIHENKNK